MTKSNIYTHIFSSEKSFCEKKTAILQGKERLIKTLSCEAAISENTLFWKSDSLTSRFSYLAWKGEKKKVELEEGLLWIPLKTLVFFKGEIPIKVVQITKCSYISFHWAWGLLKSAEDFPQMAIIPDGASQVLPVHWFRASIDQTLKSATTQLWQREINSRV